MKNYTKTNIVKSLVKLSFTSSTLETQWVYSYDLGARIGQTAGVRIFTSLMSFLSPNQWCQGTEETIQIPLNNIKYWITVVHNKLVMKSCLTAIQCYYKVQEIEYVKQSTRDEVTKQQGQHCQSPHNSPRSFYPIPSAPSSLFLPPLLPVLSFSCRSTAWNSRVT